MKFKDLPIGQYFIFIGDDAFDLKLKISKEGWFDFKKKETNIKQYYHEEEYQNRINREIKHLRIVHQLMESITNSTDSKKEINL